jgi:hypothetical protein
MSGTIFARGKSSQPAAGLLATPRGRSGLSSDDLEDFWSV